jgi:hypothetical protein
MPLVAAVRQQIEVVSVFCAAEKLKVSAAEIVR